MPEIFKDSEDKKKENSEKLKQLHSKWTKEQEELLAEWAEKASCYRWLHGRAEKKYRRSNYAFTIPVIIMSTLTGTANFAMDSFVPIEHKKTAMAAVGGVNILAGIISTLQNFLRYAELMESHRASGISWSKLNRDITIELALDPPRRKPARDFLNICRAEYDRLIEQSPMIDDSILKQFHHKFHDTDINKPEMCNGLDKCEIYKPTKEEKAAEMLANVTTKLSNKKKRVFTLDKPPPPPHEPVKEVVNQHKHELHGLASLGRVSSMRQSQLVKPKQVHSTVQQELKNMVRSIEKPKLDSVFEETLDNVESVIVEPVLPTKEEDVTVADESSNNVTVADESSNNIDKQEDSLDQPDLEKDEDITSLHKESQTDIEMGKSDESSLDEESIDFLKSIVDSPKK